MRVRVPAEYGEPGRTLWVIVLGIAIGAVLSLAIFGTRLLELQRELDVLEAGDPTGSRD